MPSGRTHLKLETALLVPCLGALGWLYWKQGVPWQTLNAFFGAYVFAMLWLSPDLDLTTSSALNRWGPLRWIWLPYAWVFRHRQSSHHLLLGPLTRILYLVLLLAGLLWGVLAILGEPLPKLQISTLVLGAIVAGMFVQNTVHILADRVSTSWRRRRRKRRL